MSDFVARYGRWAVVAGASEGIGAAFARCLAERGMDVLLIARQEQLLRDLAAELRDRFAVQTRCLVQDLADDALAEVIADITADLDIGVVVYNAAFVSVGRFLDVAPADLEKLVRVNVRGPVTVLRTLLPAMVERRRGAVVLMSFVGGLPGCAEDRRLRGQQGVQHHTRRGSVGGVARARHRRRCLLRRRHFDAGLRAGFQARCAGDDDAGQGR